MLETQRKYLHYVDQLEKELSSVNMDGPLKSDFKIKDLENSIEEVELLVPVIGAFSAGKSSLLNAFLGKNYLPVKITPETALATELRYSSEEYIEAIKPDDTIKKVGIDEVRDIAKNAHQFKYLRMFIANKKLKEIEPLILVDMPGFDSPLDLHNQAIMEYIDRGVHYIVLTSVEDGTITRSMVRQLNDIQEYGRDVSFFLSKANLRAKSEAREVAENLKDQIEEYFDIEKDVVMIDDNGGENLRKILLSIDPEELFKNIFIDALKDNYYSITETLNAIISSLGKDKNKNKDAILELQEALDKLQKERDRLINEVNGKYSSSSVNAIVEAVGKELSSSLEELINTAITGGQESMSRLISEITRTVLISRLKDSMSNISNDVVNSYAANLSDINSSMSELTMTENWLEKITDSTKSMLDAGKSGLENIIRKRGNSGNNDKMYKVITTILATTTTVLAPIIELVIIFLPELLGGLFEKYQQEKQREQIRSAVLTQVIPSLKRELRAKLPELFNQQVQEMIISISQQFESAIEDKKLAIEVTQKELNEKISNIGETIESYKNINNNITALANNTLYK